MSRDNSNVGGPEEGRFAPYHFSFARAVIKMRSAEKSIKNSNEGGAR